MDEDQLSSSQYAVYGRAEESVALLRDELAPAVLRERLSQRA